MSVAALPRIILVYAAVDWPLYMRRQMVRSLAVSAREFGSTVVAINRPLCPLSTAVKKPGRLAELFGRAGLEQVSENLYLSSPRYAIYDDIANRVPLLERVNIAALRASYRSLQKRLGIVEPNPLIWFNYPQQGYVMKVHDGSFCIQEIYDNLSDIEGRESAAVNRLEEKMRSRTDLLLTTSQRLHEKYGPFYKNAFMFGNGLDRGTFDRLSDPVLTGLPEMERFASPRIGYAGMISDRLDWTLIGALAESRPSWNFIFAGYIADGTIVDRFANCKNIHFTGTFEHASVPRILRSFDVGFMPYLDTPFFHYLNPLKFYEMAAAGLPLVASNIDELRQHPPELIRVIDGGAEAWKAALEAQIVSGAAATRKIGPAIAAGFIWEDMTRKLLERIRDEWLREE